MSKNIDERVKSAEFALTKILPSQLAPAYKASPESQLTDDQIEYNMWLEEKQKTPHKPIYGFLNHTVTICSVVFTDPLYAGARVRLISNAGEESVVDSAANPEWEEGVVATLPSDKNNGAERQGDLPCALFYLDSIDATDGIYTIQVEFWERDYLKFHEKEGLELPESVKQANVKVSKVAKKDDTSPQNLYQYQLREKLIFKPSPGLGKIACVCGDMISLEETIIQQFPTQLPSYAEYATKGLVEKNRTKPGMGAISLSGTLMKTAESLMGDFVSLNGPNVPRSASEVAQTIGLALWESTEKKQLPDFVMTGTAMAAALSAPKMRSSNIGMRLLWCRRHYP